MIRRCPSTSRVSLENACIVSRVLAFAAVDLALASCLPLTSALNRSNSCSTSMWAYQTSRFRIPAACCIRARYSAAPVSTTLRRSAAEYPRSRPATSRLAPSRFRSHSHGPGRVSSKSLMSNINCRSGEANTPKLDRCASPQDWTFRPERAVAARSAAMISAAPRKNVNGDTNIRP